MNDYTLGSEQVMAGSSYTESHEPKLLQCIALRSRLAGRRGSDGQPALGLLLQSSLLGARTHALSCTTSDLDRSWLVHWSPHKVT